MTALSDLPTDREAIKEPLVSDLFRENGMFNKDRGAHPFVTSWCY